MKYYNLILDLDGTLISLIENNNYDLVRGRPNLAYFLHYVFSKFRSVSIWTNASTNWYMYCYENILKQNMPSNENFSLIITADNNVIYKKLRYDIQNINNTEASNFNIDATFGNIYIKNLDFLYEQYPQFDKTNTFIIDDMPYTYCMNPQNAIPIKPYQYDFWSRMNNDNTNMHIEDDSELLRIIFYFKMELFNHIDMNSLSINDS